MSKPRSIIKSVRARLITLPKDFPDWDLVLISMEKVSEDECILRIRRLK